MGKTRLALEWASSQLGQFKHGIYFVQLAPLHSAEVLATTIAATLGFSFYKGDRLRQQLLDYLRQKNMLLLLDNFEQLLPSSAAEGWDEDGVALVADILKTAAEVKILVTSRARLKLQGEVLFPLTGLDYPAKLGNGPSGQKFGAIELFRHSARRVQPEFELADDNWADVVQICHLVEGMPLGIVLAAAWVELLSPAEIVTQLAGVAGQGLAFLETDWHDVPERQRSMRAVFDHSWKLLNDPERDAFRQLTIFRGGFTAQAAQQVAGASLRTLLGLVNKSFLQRSPEGRYEIPELLRQFGAEKLAHQTSRITAATHPLEPSARDRHSVYYCAFLQERETDLKGPRQRVALEEIEAEGLNVSAAWEWVAEQGQIARLEQALEALCRFYEWRGRYPEAIAACQLAEQKLEEGRINGAQRLPAVKLLAKILTWHSFFCYESGQITRAERLLEQSQALLNSSELAEADTRPERAFFLQQRGWQAERTDLDQARRLLEQSAALYQVIGDQWAAAHTLTTLGFFTFLSGNHDEARRLHQESLAMLRPLGDQRGIAKTLLWLGNIFKRQEGGFERAERLGRESLALMKESGDRFGIGDVAFTLGSTLTWQGKFAEGKRLLEEGLSIFNDLGHHRLQAYSHNLLGDIAMHAGQYEQVRAHLQISLSIMREIGEANGLGLALNILADVALAEKKYAEAKSLLQESVATFRQAGQRTSLGFSLATLGYVERGLENPRQARQYLAEALRIAADNGDLWVMFPALPATALLLADWGEKVRAVELYALASRYPLVANSRWFEDVAGRHIAAVAAVLPPEVVAATQERGRARDLWATVAELVAELETQDHQSQ
jgi:tetratricopeptide (TPR) repeat protein